MAACIFLLSFSPISLSTAGSYDDFISPLLCPFRLVSSLTLRCSLEIAISCEMALPEDWTLLDFWFAVVG